MLGAVTAAKAAAGSRTLVRLAALLALTTVCRAGQDGRPAPPRSGSGCSRRAAPLPPSGDSAPTQVTQHNTLYTPDTAHCSTGHPVLVAPMLARVPLCCHGGQVAVVAAWSRAAAVAGPGSAFSCSASPRPRPAPGLVTGAAADVNTPLPRPLPRPLTTISWTRCWAAAACLGQHMWSRSEPTQYMLYLLYIIHVVYMLYAGHN